MDMTLALAATPKEEFLALQERLDRQLRAVMNELRAQQKHRREMAPRAHRQAGGPTPGAELP